jgi:hypothetical protein
MRKYFLLVLIMVLVAFGTSQVESAPMTYDKAHARCQSYNNGFVSFDQDKTTGEWICLEGNKEHPGPMHRWPGPKTDNRAG